MIGGDQKRFCFGCGKDVYNLSKMRSREAWKLAANNEGKICIRIGRSPATSENKRLHQISRRSTAVAVGAIMASVSLSTITYSQNRVPSRLETAKEQRKNKKRTSQISFTILDATGVSIPGATVALTAKNTKERSEVLTDQSGLARFSDLKQGDYDIDASFPHFRPYRNTIRIHEPIEPNVEIELEIGSVTGVFIINWSEIPLFRAIAQEDNDIVKKMISDGFDVNTTDNAKSTPLHVAVEHGNLEIVRFLLDRGAKANARDIFKRPPILMIDNSDDEATELYRLLIGKGAEVNVRNEDSETLLMLAAEDDIIEIVKLLLEAGANPALKDDDGDTAEDLTDSLEIKEILRNFRRNPKQH